MFGDARKSAIDDALALGLFVHGEGDALRMNGLSLFSKTLLSGQVVHLVADTPPHFETRAAEQRVYAGADSYELMEKSLGGRHRSRVSASRWDPDPVFS